MQNEGDCVSELLNLSTHLKAAVFFSTATVVNSFWSLVPVQS